MVTSRLVQEFLDAQQWSSRDSETYQNARQALLASDKAEVLALFETRLQAHDEEERASVIRGLDLLYGREAIDTIIHATNDPSPIVRMVACGCLQDYDDRRVIAALVDRLQSDADCQVRGLAANSLGHIGAVEALPALHHAWQSDLEVDELGYTPSGSAEDAMTSVLTDWVSRQIQGTPPGTFRELTRTGKLTGSVTAESIPIDADGSMTRALRYAHLPHSAFGPSCFIKMDLKTSLIAPFEIDVEYADPTCVIRRILIYERITDWDKFNWAVHTILDPTAMKSPPQP